MNNRRSGHDWEREFISRIFAPLFNLVHFNGKNHSGAQVGSSRMFNPSEDAKKIDVSYNNVDEIINRLKHQLKKCTNRSKSTKNIDVSSLQEMVVDNNDIRILVTKLYTSPKKNEKYATLPLEDFLEILKEWYELKKKYEETRKT